jgi:5-methyltetrahydropteroyltriglutamate--homocysteine methyltransferase
VVAATRDLERGRTTPDVVDRCLAEDQEAFVAVQREAGLDLYSDGLLRWQDIFRPLVDATSGMSARTLVRWFDNNSFFRAPEPPAAGIQAIADGSLPGVFEASEEALPQPRVATLPSPYTFSRAAHTDGDRDALARELGSNLLAPVAGGLAGRGFDVIHLEEPWLAYAGIDDDAWPAFEDALASIRQAIAGQAALVLHLYFGDASPHADRLRKLPVDAIGIDFVETDLDALGSNWEVGVLVGAIDGRRSVVEHPQPVAAFAQRVFQELQPETMYLSSNSELELLPTEVAAEKVRTLGKAANMLKEALG